MISFVIIGKNIESTISLCLDSVFQFIRLNKISSYDIIYVDSNSNDGSVEIAKRYPISILIITGEVNAAIGRNVGALNTKGDTLFFIDGDMELIPDFYECVFHPSTGLPIYPFINGYLCHKFYDNKFKFLYTKCETISDHPILRDVTGGLMIVKRECWQLVNGMDERLIRNQDLDFGLRLSKAGIQAMLYNRLFALHHTSEYFNEGRYYDFYFSKALFSPGLLMRKHIFSKAYIKRHYLQVLNTIILFVCIIMIFVKPFLSLILITAYTALQLLRVIKILKTEKSLFKSFLFKFLFNFYCLLGFIFYYPSFPNYTVNKVSVLS